MRLQSKRFFLFPETEFVPVGTEQVICQSDQIITANNQDLDEMEVETFNW